MNRFLVIAAGAALGANARYLVNLWAAGRFGADFPYGTLLVNITGSFILGFLLALSTDRFDLSPETRLLLATGFLGSYTTFSSYAVESLNLWRDDGIWLAVRNIFLNNGIGLIFALLGTSVARWLG
ncbi:MAG: fluoride efflux transporter CrcB [Anaerolineae bacterium]|uniref:fluoride efflux transporter CrcB n=1 Tax=Promineifilum sp. TaxID=2664178 RepID=UPI001D7BA72E|nr:fluoride efflux transporter CrcB [Anaerolineales bacterium]MCB8933985.1 fluoride efflux transporter CrcB [Promineifilum sp.]MCO5179385.1 fluoride efflux transporter CrcB [Promineifilum sp.]MCW5845900.1 fluoride efflux transporter CrcB [Anaerolineae bacterium]